MALAMKVGVPSSAFFCPTVFQSLQCESHSREPVGCGPYLAARPYPQLVSQLDNDQSPTITTFDVSRRWFVAVTASGTTWGLLGQPEAQAGKRKPPPPVEKKVEEDKGLSAYDQKILASVRRKEALRLSIEGQKAKDIYKTHLRAQPRANSSEFKTPPSSSTSTFNTSRDITKGVVSRIKLF